MATHAARRYTPAQIESMIRNEVRRQGGDPNGATANVLVATAGVETGGTFNPRAVGDHGTSFGLFQLHEGGALGSRTAAWAFNPLNSIRDRVSAFLKAGVTDGAGAARVQNPADPVSYARSVDRFRATTAPATSWVSGDTQGLNPTLLQQLGALGQQLGQTVHITSGKRTTAEQAALYARYKAGGTLAAKPGTSNHESGVAADAYIGSTPLSRYPGAATAAASLGLGFPVAGEAWHTELTDPAKAASSPAPASASSDASSSNPLKSIPAAISGLGDSMLEAAVSAMLLLAGVALIVIGLAKAAGVDGTLSKLASSVPKVVPVPV